MKSGSGEGFDVLRDRLNAVLSRDRACEWLREIVRVPSPQTELLEGEPQLRVFIRTALAPRMPALGFDRVREDDMGNLIAESGSPAAARSLMLVMHAMNQPASTMPDPYDANVVDGTPWGLPGRAVRGKGASEQKGTLAAVLHAIEAVRVAGIPLEGRLVFLCLVSGETGKADAIRNVVEVEGVRADAAFVYGNDLDLQIGNRGRVDLSITVHGRASHSSRPNEGVNAVSGAMALLARLATMSAPRHHPGMGTAWLTCNGIESFPKSTHTVQDRCVLRLDQRLLPGDDPGAAVRAIEAAATQCFDEWRDPVSGGTCTFRLDPGAYMYPSLIDEDALPARLVREGCEVMLGRSPRAFYGQSAHDQGYLNHVGIPTANFGAGEQSLAHTDNDMASVDRVYDAACVYAWMIARHLGAEDMQTP